MHKARPLIRTKISKYGDYEITISSSAVILICWVVLLALILLGGLPGDDLTVLVNKLPRF